MENQSNEQLLLSMIVAELTHAKMINGLISMHIDPCTYCIDLGYTIISLIGFDKEEKCKYPVFAFSSRPEKSKNRMSFI